MDPRRFGYRQYERARNRVVCIDHEAKQVEVHDLRRDRTYEESYDKLVLCTGAE